ncbi:cupin domain-containing protein [Cupriavidus pinatubonensis]|uniref:cupin domain-containing protein n=1 Tax=Cupriavidus pinatubonensis TaxID=248026 RepID=UPI001C730237|nr:cupin domain-containing protein [Cupriavidus pinatubonensis]QYY30874.1 cupin domain-containing protein [Cupriavidus pinatubonensis]
MSGFRTRKLSETEVISYGPASDLSLIIGDEEGTTPIRAALQTCQPGYEVPIHCHPYIEYLIVLEGSAEFTIEDGGTQKVLLGKGDCVELFPGIWHSFATNKEEVTQLMGIHVSPDRIVNYKPGVKTDSRGFRIQDDGTTAEY